MSRRLLSFVSCASVLVVLAAAAADAHAGLRLIARMTNDAEVTIGPLLTDDGAPRPTSFGTAEFDLNDERTAMTMVATIFNIDITGDQTPDDANDDLLAAHIHASATVTPDTTAPVVWGFFGMPFNETDPNDQVVTPFATGVGGTITGKWDLLEGNGTTLTDQLDNILNGRSYINFHTTQFPAGEIRGTLVPLPPAVVPGALLGGALLAGSKLRQWRAARKRT